MSRKIWKVIIEPIINMKNHPYEIFIFITCICIAGISGTLVSFISSKFKSGISEGALYTSSISLLGSILYSIQGNSSDEDKNKKNKIAEKWILGIAIILLVMGIIFYLTEHKTNAKFQVLLLFFSVIIYFYLVALEINPTNMDEYCKTEDKAVKELQEKGTKISEAEEGTKI